MSCLAGNYGYKWVKAHNIHQPTKSASLTILSLRLGTKHGQIRMANFKTVKNKENFMSKDTMTEPVAYTNSQGYTMVLG